MIWRLQWSHARPCVETGVIGTGAEREGHASMEPRTAVRGNPSICDAAAHPLTASMEPRTAVRGNAVIQGKEQMFNKASMEPRTAVRGNRRFLCKSRRRDLCFNGATHGRAWKQGTGRLKRLQIVFASMEPRTAVRGNSKRQRTLLLQLVSFNGATHGRAWKR